MLVRTTSALTRLSPYRSALLVSHSFLLAAYCLLYAYVRQRFPEARAGLPVYTLFAFSLFPPTLFMRMAYSESLFVFLTILTMYGIVRRWPVLAIASVIGGATGTRFAGVALLLPLGLHVWCNSGSFKRAAATFVAILPLALWGLTAYILYQWRTFKEPLAFIKTQDHWRLPRARRSLGQASRLGLVGAGLVGVSALVARLRGALP